MQNSIRRLSSLLPALGGGSRAAAAACDSILRGPLMGESSRHLSSQISAPSTQAEPLDESWWAEVQGAGDANGSGGGDDVAQLYSDGYEQSQHNRRYEPRMEAPIEAHRTLDDYHNMVLTLSRHKRAYLIRDVLDEMSLNGVRPDRFILQTGLFACMKSRKLGDAMFFFEEMKRRGMQPDSAAYGSAISACGRAGHVGRAVELRDEMLRRGLEMTLNIRLAILHAFAEAGRIRQTRETFEELQATGHRANEFAYAGLANCFRSVPQSALPPDAEAQLLALLEEFKAERAVVDAEAAAVAEVAASDAYLAAAQVAADSPQQFEPRGRGTQSSAPFSPLLVVYNAVLNSLVELGCHETAKRLYSRMGDEGLSPDHVTFGNMIRSYLQQALGRHRQPQSNQLTALLEEKLQGVDLQADMDAVLAEDAMLRTALEAVAGREAATAEEAFAAATVMVDCGDEEEEEQAQPAALLDLGLGSEHGTSDVMASDGEEEGTTTPLLEGARSGTTASGSGWRPRTRGPRKPFAGLSEKELLQLVRERATNHARSRLRFEVFRQHLDLDAWYEALHLYQEVLDQGLVWGPDITYTMLKAALDLQAAGVEDAIAVAHAVMDTFDRQGLFVDVENGTEVLQLAVRRDVGDLSLAHRIYDNMRKTQRVPKTPCMFKYMRALTQREPEAIERLIEVCSRITSDPDRSDRIMPLKKEAWQRRQVLLDASGSEGSNRSTSSGRHSSSSSDRGFQQGR